MFGRATIRLGIGPHSSLNIQRMAYIFSCMHSPIGRLAQFCSIFSGSLACY